MAFICTSPVSTARRQPVQSWLVELIVRETGITHVCWIQFTDSKIARKVTKPLTTAGPSSLAPRPSSVSNQPGVSGLRGSGPENVAMRWSEALDHSRTRLLDIGIDFMVAVQARQITAPGVNLPIMDFKVDTAKVRYLAGRIFHGLKSSIAGEWSKKD